MEYGSWEDNRRGNLEWLRAEGALTDVKILCDQQSFPAHRVVLAAHSDYFYRSVKACPGWQKGIGYVPGCSPVA